LDGEAETCDLGDVGRIAPLEQAMLYIYTAKTLRAMLIDAKQAIKLVDDDEARNVQDMIDAITHELSTRKD